MPCSMSSKENTSPLMLYAECFQKLLTSNKDWGKGSTLERAWMVSVLYISVKKNKNCVN